MKPPYNNFGKMIARHDSNFFINNIEILYNLNRTINGTQFTYAAFAVLILLLNLPPNWNLTIQGLATILNCSKESVRKIIKVLEQCGYVKITKAKNNGNFFTHYYYVRETLDDSWWDKLLTNSPEVYRIAEEDKESQQSELSDDEALFSRPYSQGPVSKALFSGPETAAQYNTYNIIHNNKIHNNKKQKKEKTKKGQTTVCPSLKNNLNKIKLEQITQENITTKSTVKNKKEELTGEAPVKTFEGIDLEGDIEEMEHGKSRAQLAKEERQLKRALALQAKIEQEQNTEKDTIANYAEKTVGELTEEENTAAKIQRLCNVTQAKLNELESKTKKAESTKKRIMRRLDTEITDVALRAELKKYFSGRIQKDKIMSNETYDALLDRLLEVSKGNVESMINIVRRATEGAWRSFYAPTEKKPEQKWKKPEVTTTTITQENSFDYEIATDADGNQLQF